MGEPNIADPDESRRRASKTSAPIEPAPTTSQCSRFIDGFAGHLHGHFHLRTYPLVRDYYRRFLEDEKNEHRLADAAIHLAHAYLFKGEELPTPASSGLLGVLFEKHPGSVAAKLPWLYYRDMHEQEKVRSTAFLDKYWPRLRDLFLWRARNANERGFPADVDVEFDWYARWIGCLRDTHATVAQRLEMLELIVPFLCRARFGAREAVVSFLAVIVEQSPAAVVKLFRKMSEGAPKDALVDGRVTSDVRKIVEVAAVAGGDARSDALAIANWYGARGSLGLRDIYERYSRE